MLKRCFSLVLTIAILISIFSVFSVTPVYAASSRPEYKDVVDLTLHSSFKSEQSNVIPPPEYKYVAVFITDDIRTQYSYEGARQFRNFEVTTIFSKTPVINRYDEVIYGSRSWWNFDMGLPVIEGEDTIYINWVNYLGTISGVDKARNVASSRAAYNPEYMYCATNGNGPTMGYIQYYVADRSTARLYNNNTVSLTYDHVINVGAVDTNRLEMLIEQAKTLVESNYTQESWEELKIAQQDAEYQLEFGVHGQRLINKLSNNLQDALDNLVRLSSSSITTFTVDTFPSTIDQTEKTIQFTVPNSALTGEQLVGVITELETENPNNQLGFVIDGTTHHPFSLGSTVGFKHGDKVFAVDGELYTILLENPTVTMGEIRTFAVSNYASAINQTDKTITFTPPASAIDGNRLVGTISALDADGGSLGFIIDGVTHQPFSLGSMVGFKSGDKVFASDDALYTIIIEPQEAAANRIHQITIGGSTGLIDEVAKTVTFHVSQSAMLADGRFAGNIDVLATDDPGDTLTFVVWGAEYSGYGIGDYVGFHDLSEVYVKDEHTYSIRLVVT